jgi:hypothetical protein
MQNMGEAMDDDHTRTPLAGGGLMTENDPEGIPYSEKFNRVREELIKDPARTDGLIAATIRVASKATVYRVREMLVAEGTVRDVPVPERVTQAGSLAKNNASANHRNGNGNRIFVPKGRAVIDLCREAMAAEEAGMSAEDASRVIGFGIRSYREAKNIVLIGDRPDLSEIERAMVNTSLREMEETRRTTAAFKRIKDISDRLFGNAQKRNSKTITRTLEKRNERFQNTMAVLVETCLSASQIDIPVLDAEGTAYAVAQVEEASKNLKLLKKSIQQRRYE